MPGHENGSIPTVVLHHLGEASSLATFHLAVDGRVLWRNGAAERLVGTACPRLSDTDGLPLPEEAGPLSTPSLRDGCWGPRSLRLIDATDGFTWVEAWAERLGPPSAPEGILLFLRPDCGRIEASAREHGAKLEAICRVVGRTAHDCNNKIGVVGGYTEILEETLPPEGEARSFLGPILEATNLLAEQVRNLLGFRGGRISRPKALDPATFLDERRAVLAAACGEEMDLILEVDGDGGVVMIDPPQLEWILVELLSNARRAATGPGRIEIHVETRQDPGAEKEIRFTVSDDGPGLDATGLEGALDGSFSTRLGRGRGLGLPTAQTILQQHDGRLELFPGDERGTKVRFSLPWKAAPRPPQGC